MTTAWRPIIGLMQCRSRAYLAWPFLLSCWYYKLFSCANRAKFQRDDCFPHVISFLIDVGVFVQVWEIRAADLSISPVHKAGVGLVSTNLSLSLLRLRSRGNQCAQEREECPISSQKSWVLIIIVQFTFDISGEQKNRNLFSISCFSCATLPS